MDDKKQVSGPFQGDKASSKKFESESRHREEECDTFSNCYSLLTLLDELLEDPKTTEGKFKECEKYLTTGNSFVQKQNFAIDYLYKPVKIAKYENQMSYNIPIQIECDHNIGASDDSRTKLLLGVLISDAQIKLQTQPIIDECAEVSATIIKTRTRRNVFKCMSIQGETDENPVLYGEDFYICLSDIDGPTVYLTGVVSDLNNFEDTEEPISLALTTVPDKFSKFHVIDPNPEKMITLKGTPVKTFDRVCIVQSYFNLLLAIDTNNVVKTSYCIDYKMHCYTYRNSRHRITSESIWKFITQAIDEDAEDDDGSFPN